MRPSISVLCVLCAASCAQRVVCARRDPVETQPGRAELFVRDWSVGSSACHVGRPEGRVTYESQSKEFDRLVGPKPTSEFIVHGSADAVRAHEGAVFLERGAEGEDAPTLVFTTKPFAREDGRNVSQVKSVIVDGADKGRIKVLFESANLANGATLGFDGRIYFCFQGGPARGDPRNRTYPSGIFSVDPHNASDRRVVTDAWNDGSDGFDPLYYSSPNDVVVGRDGSVWFTDPAYAYFQGYVPPPSLGEWVWHVDAKTGRAAVAADGFSRPNGLVFSPDEKTLYVTDTGYATGIATEPTDVAGPRSIYAFDVIKRRKLANRRLIYVADRGIPDGIKVDAAGRIYTGCADGVHVLSRDGALLGKIKLPGKNPAANLAFGRGRYRSTLYVLDETSVTAVALPGTRGQPVGKERAPPANY